MIDRNQMGLTTRAENEASRGADDFGDGGKIQRACSDVGLRASPREKTLLLAICQSADRIGAPLERSVRI